MTKQSTASTSVAPDALETVSGYVKALIIGNSHQMHHFCSPDFVLDWVHGDAFEDKPLSIEETKQFWPAWFAGFPEMDYNITRTIAAETVVVTQWTFTGTHTHLLGSPVFNPPLVASGRTVRFRGVSVYDIKNGLIIKETTYMDLATLMVELGVTP